MKNKISIREQIKTKKIFNVVIITKILQSTKIFVI